MLGQTNFQARTRGFSRFDEDELVLVADDHFALDTRHVRGGCIQSYVIRNLRTLAPTKFTRTEIS